MKTGKKIISAVLAILLLTACEKTVDEAATTFAYTTAEAVTQATLAEEVLSSVLEQTAVLSTAPQSEKTTAETTTVVSQKEHESATQAANQQKDFCYFTISCETINGNIDKLSAAKKLFVPSDGIIIKDLRVEISKGDTAFDVIKKACKGNTCKANCQYCRNGGIQLEYTYTPAFDNYYIEGIHQLYEKDCGTQSGWMYSVNGEFPNVGCSAYSVKAGDRIVFAYTCDMGEDLKAK